MKSLFRIPPILQYTKADAEKFRAGLPVEQIERSSILHRSPNDQVADVPRRHFGKLGNRDIFATAEVVAHPNVPRSCHAIHTSIAQGNHLPLAVIISG
ncbi:hypothetical protein [Mesorhizobium sp. M9A.F.Ca.ET.002.03.1.2]|uniref:hypothetical protein n=1 Tax=Mesorhizobium sp. M9A.F.Ca.ET.002.03.1.2 TaxID=2493668 RepID=UPI001FE0D963|nr:hypothetical protein [Mesorhizobium sp. M9A.F.Ca.ET.002.03.1.2]